MKRRNLLAAAASLLAVPMLPDQRSNGWMGIDVGPGRDLMALSFKEGDVWINTNYRSQATMTKVENGVWEVSGGYRSGELATFSGRDGAGRSMVVDGVELVKGQRILVLM